MQEGCMKVTFICSKLRRKAGAFVSCKDDGFVVFGGKNSLAFLVEFSSEM
jgi:hypothetical protein